MEFFRVHASAQRRVTPEETQIPEAELRVLLNKVAKTDEHLFPLYIVNRIFMCSLRNKWLWLTP